jgi:sortase A
LRIKDVVLGLVSLALIGAGATLIITFFVNPSTREDLPSEESQDFNVPVLEEENTQAPGQVRGPEDKTLVLTVPKMEIFEALVPDAAGNDEEKLRDYAAIHLEDTGFPWEPGANVYIAGHRLGYVGTPSWLAFWDLNKMEVGDKVFVTDSMGRRYVYRVFNEFIVDPDDVHVTRSVKGKNILTLQTCTLPDYSQRLIVQAELTDTTEKAA